MLSMDVVVNTDYVFGVKLTNELKSPVFVAFLVGYQTSVTDLITMTVCIRHKSCLMIQYFVGSSINQLTSTF
jgi:hypothetical protein